MVWCNYQQKLEVKQQAIVHKWMMLFQNVIMKSICRIMKEMQYLPWLKLKITVFLEIQFAKNESRHIIEIEVLYDGKKEIRESFTVHLKPDRNMIADTRVGLSLAK